MLRVRDTPAGSASGSRLLWDTECNTVDESGGDEEGGEVGKESVRENLEGDESAGSCDNNDHGNFERLMNLHQAKSHYT